MDYKDKPAGTDGEPYIWLRYTTQFTTGGRTHSIEMGIPVPVGASAEMREQLIREAESGMDQLTRHVENRVTQMLQRNARPQEPAARSITGTGYSQASSGATSPASPAGRPQHAGSQFAAPAQAESQAAPRETSQSSEAPQPPVPLTRQTVGANMPSTPGIPGDASGNMKLSQFMQFIRDTWGLTPKHAMDLLNLKSLNGLNYRDLVRQLQPLVEQSANNAPASNQKPAVTGQSRPPEKPSRSGAPAPAVSSSPSPSRTPLNSTVVSNQKAGASNQDAGSMTPASPASTSTRPSSSPTRPASSATPLPGATRAASGPKPSTDERGNNSQATDSPSPGPQSQQPAPAKAPVVPIRMVRNEPYKYKFDEEEDEDGEDELPSIEEEDDNNEQKLAMARIKLDELKEVRGASAANPARLAVLHNVLNSQIDNEQLQRLIQATWGVTTVKKLKVDQVEALISWAKEDYFVEEVEAVLDLLDEEEPYARSDW
ncbi:MAG TPA: hypothetical protein VF043_07930 [Ktedonobacteraceae bacterium]